MNRFHEGSLLAERYQLCERIASGGMADVWAATDTVLDRPVAVKIMRPDTGDDEVFARRFRDEATHTARLSHANIAQVFDYGQHDNLAFLVMERVPGQPLSRFVADQGPQRPEVVRSILGQAALALHAAHEGGVVHRDIKPANILLTPDGRVKLTDFGISRATDGVGHTRTGEILGTPHYLSPEQALGASASGSSDIYSLGLVGHELLTGTRAFDRGTPVATALAQVHDPPPPLPAGLPPDLVAVINRCLVKTPEGRPASALDVAVALGMVSPLGAGEFEKAAMSVMGDALLASSTPSGPDVLRMVDGRGRPQRPGREDEPLTPPTPLSLAPQVPTDIRVHWGWIPATAVGVLLVAFAFFLATR